MDPKHNHIFIATLGLVILLAGVSVFTNLTQVPLAITSQSQTAAVSDFNSSLIANYTFDDTTNDSAGSNNGTAVGGPTYTTGKIGQAISFDGDDYVNLGTGTALAGGSAITVSAWVKPISATGEIASRRDQSEGTMSWKLHVSGSNAKFGIAVSAGSNPDYTVTSNIAINSSGTTWTHIVATYSTSDGLLKMYINGNPDATANGSGTIAAQAITKTLIGAYTNSSNQPANLFAGSIDDVRIYNRVLSASEVQELYNYTGSSDLPPSPLPPTSGTPPILPPVNPLPPQTGSNQILTVKQNGTGNFSTIQACVDFAKAGDTCLVASGTYQETVSTVKSGVANSWITIRGDSGARLNGLKVSHRHIRVEGFTFDGVNVGQQSAVRLYNGTYNFQFVNNVVANTPLNVRALSVDHGISETSMPDNVLIEGNRFVNIGDHTLGLDGTHWLVKDNYFENAQGWDAIICTASDSVFTGNVFRISNSNGNPNHTDIIQTDHFGNFGQVSKNIFFEKNIILNAAGTQIGNLSAGPVTTMGHWVFRNNVYANIGGALNGGLPNTYWYNNTFYRATQNTSNPLRFIHLSCTGSTDANCFGNGRDGRVINNIFSENGDNTTANGYGWYAFEGSVTGGFGDYNMVTGAGGIAKLAFNEPHGINGGNPNFLNLNNPLGADQQLFTADDGLRLQQNSSLIDKGGFLTKVISTSGSGSTLQVRDAGYFTDGFGLVPGDLIQLEGSTQHARIVSVDFSSNTITVDSVLTWVRDQGITLAYEGTRPDIGAYEYQGSGTTPPPTTPPVTPPTYKPGDFNRDGAVNALDFSLLSGAWNQNNSTYDLNTDGIVNSLDYVIMVQNWTI